MATKTTIRIGDLITVVVTNTAGTDVTATLTVNKIVRLNCGCYRLVCDRPGPTPRPNGVAVYTGCSLHEGDLS